MTSLGLLQYSDINESSPIGGNITAIEKKRQARHNITVKKRPTEDTTTNNNVQNMLNLINDTNGYDDDSGNSGLADFNPPPRAEVSSKLPPLKNGLQQQPQMQPQMQQPEQRQKNIDYDENPIIVNEPQTNASDVPLNNNNDVKPRQYPTPLDSQEGFGSLPKTYANDYYKQYVPYFNQTTNQGTNNRDHVLDKLNYMIHLLEEQKDEKTGHVMEEVILYSFLGVFIIFIVDSFARAGKYTR